MNFCQFERRHFSPRLSLCSAAALAWGHAAKHGFQQPALNEVSNSHTIVTWSHLRWTLGHSPLQGHVYMAADDSGGQWIVKASRALKS